MVGGFDFFDLATEQLHETAQNSKVGGPKSNGTEATGLLQRSLRGSRCPSMPDKTTITRRLLGTSALATVAAGTVRAQTVTQTAAAPQPLSPGNLDMQLTV